MMRLPSVELTRARWLTARGFPHIVLADAVYPDVAALLGSEFPPPEDDRWKTYTGPLEHGKQEASSMAARSGVRDMHQYLASSEFVGWLRALTRTPDLIPDPHRVGGGIHQVGLGGRLGMHVDFNVSPADSHLIRAVNVILFVGDHPGWEAAWGGYLSLGTARQGGGDVMPLPGTLVVFEASDTSWHGHPVPMQPSPVDGSLPPLRKSIPAYYYRPVRQDERVVAHSTRFYEVESGNCPHKRPHDFPGLEFTFTDGRCALCGGTL